MVPEIIAPHFTLYHLEGPWEPRLHPKLHRMTAEDNSPPHDHPVDFQTYVWDGGYLEEVFHRHPNGTWTTVQHIRRVGTTHFVPAETIHRIIRLLAPECHTLTVPGPIRREWKHYPEAVA